MQPPSQRTITPNWPEVVIRTESRDGGGVTSTNADAPSIGELGEFGLIAAMAQRLAPGPGTVVGIGDDAAVLAAPDGRVVATTDFLLEGRHFRRDWAGPAVTFRPAFGPDSRFRHAGNGAAELLLPGIAGLRRDVDTGEDLRAAARLGLGPRTSAVAAELLRAAGRHRPARGNRQR